MVKTLFVKQKLQAIIVLLLVFCFCASCNGIKSDNTAASTVSNKTINDSISVYNFEEIEPLLYTYTNKTYIVNFWAMWCAPCVKELPYIEAYADKYPDVEVLLVSMDFPKDIDTKLKPFLKTKNITNKVVILDDPDSNTWIDKIDSNWSGAIPFTIVFNNKKRAFFERSFESVEDLETEINKTINN
ncbi:TlpA disulfide reductase family protein [uncultured Lacinutrix sp.]|uniref:TlpA family protein disulfide reductase n=1 Tax=uncultured Lacinutrix sp. TaxID=574032 RepID=UPI0026020C3C|nr:TlpA disulfide reductase family protein [uncultured Lacinutrix sp.]